MDVAALKAHLRTLVTLDKTDAPMISCYLNLGDSAEQYRAILDERVDTLLKSQEVEALPDIMQALESIENFLATDLSPSSKGVAIFSRSGAIPFFLALQFQVPLPNWVVVDTIPKVYPLVELKDTYHRFVVLLMTNNEARIMEVNLGAVTEQMWAERPALRERVDSGWSKEQYLHHREAQTDEFIREKVRILDRLLSAGGYANLILAGNQKMVARMRAELPGHLAAKVVDVVNSRPHDRISDVVAATLRSFVAHEGEESLAAAYKLQREVMRQGLAAVGAEATLAALHRSQVDTLILARDYEPEKGWACSCCGASSLTPRPPDACLDCGDTEFREFGTREEMVRLADQHGCTVEIVGKSGMLTMLGGVGCLLRYLSPNSKRPHLNSTSS